jgi:hypothetical protein
LRCVCRCVTDPQVNRWCRLATLHVWLADGSQSDGAVCREQGTCQYIRVLQRYRCRYRGRQQPSDIEPPAGVIRLNNSTTGVGWKHCSTPSPCALCGLWLCAQGSSARHSLGCDVEERACMGSLVVPIGRAQAAGTRTAARDGSHLPCVMDDGRKTKQGTHACTTAGIDTKNSPIQLARDRSTDPGRRRWPSKH